MSIGSADDRELIYSPDINKMFSLPVRPHWDDMQEWSEAPGKSNKYARVAPDLFLLPSRGINGPRRDVHYSMEEALKDQK